MDSTPVKNNSVEYVGDLDLRYSGQTCDFTSLRSGENEPRYWSMRTSNLNLIIWKKTQSEEIGMNFGTVSKVSKPSAKKNRKGDVRILFETYEGKSIVSYEVSKSTF